MFTNKSRQVREVQNVALRSPSAAPQTWAHSCAVCSLGQKKRGGSFTCHSRQAQERRCWRVAAVRPPSQNISQDHPERRRIAHRGCHFILASGKVGFALSILPHTQTWSHSPHREKRGCVCVYEGRFMPQARRLSWRCALMGINGAQIRQDCDEEKSWVSKGVQTWRRREINDQYSNSK